MPVALFVASATTKKEKPELEGQLFWFLPPDESLRASVVLVKGANGVKGINIQDLVDAVCIRTRVKKGDSNWQVIYIIHCHPMASNGSVKEGCAIKNLETELKCAFNINDPR